MHVTFEFHLRCHYETGKAVILMQMLAMRTHSRPAWSDQLVKLADFPWGALSSPVLVLRRVSAVGGSDAAALLRVMDQSAQICWPFSECLYKKCTVAFYFMPGEQNFFFFWQCSPTVLLCGIWSYHSMLLLYLFGNDAPPIESCIHVSCKKLCCFVLFAIVFFSCLFWRCASGLKSHLDHNFLLPVDLTVIFCFE